MTHVDVRASQTCTPCGRQRSGWSCARRPANCPKHALQSAAPNALVTPHMSAVSYGGDSRCTRFQFDQLSHLTR